MLGFSTFSETPLAQSNASTLALAFVPSVETLTSVDTLSYIAKANLVTSSVSATQTVVAFFDVDAQAVTDLGSVFAGTSLDSLTDVDAQATTIPVAVAANFIAEPFEDVDAKARVYNMNVEGVARAYEIEYDADANTTILSIPSFLSSEDFSDVDAQANTTLSSIDTRLYKNLSDPVAINFDFNAIRDSYDRTRSVYVITQDLNRTIHIPPEDRTVYIEDARGNNTVYIIK